MKPFYLFFAFFCCKNTNFAQTTLYSENFEAGMPKNIEIFGNDAATHHPSVAYVGEGWKVVGGARFAAEMDSFAVSTSYNNESSEPQQNANEWLILPEVLLGSDAVFSWNAKSFDPTYPDAYEVRILEKSVLEKNAFATEVAKPNVADIIYSNKAENAKWTAREVSLAAFANKTVTIAIRNTTAAGYLLGIDDLKVVSGKPQNSQKSSVFTEIQAAPNPTTGVFKLHLQCKTTESVRIEILNTQEQTVKKIAESKILDDVFTVNFGESQPNGLYFIKISTATENHTELLFLNK